jgi:hypothetical protein
LLACIEFGGCNKLWAQYGSEVGSNIGAMLCPPTNPNLFHVGPVLV